MKKSLNARLIAALCLVVFAAACGSTSSPEDAATVATDSSEVADEAPGSAADETSTDEGDSSEAADAAAAPEIDAEIFLSDEGAGCGIYVSVDEAAVTASTNMREMLWLGIVGEDVRNCDFSDVEEVGLITVQALDEYEQPDWSSVIEHSFFAVDDWTQLVEQCFESPLPQGCDATLESLLTQ